MAYRPVFPNEEDNIKDWIEDYLQDLQTALPCRVQRYYHETQEADLVPVVRHAVARSDGGYDYEDLPVLPLVPVIHPRTHHAFIHIPIQEGDFVLAIFTSAHAEFWRHSANGELTDPGDLRRHHLTNGVCIPGFFPKFPESRRLPIVDGPGGNSKDLIISLTNPGPGPGLPRTTKITIKNDTGDVIIEGGGLKIGGEAADRLVALAAEVEQALDQLRTFATTHTHPVPMSATTSASETILPARPAVGTTKIKVT